MSIMWEEKTIPLKFLLGEFCFFKVHFNLKSGCYHFLDIVDEICIPQQHSTESNLDGFLFYSFPLATQLKELNIGNTYTRYTPRQYRRFYIDMSLSFEDYMSKFSGKTRGTLRRKIRTLENELGSDNYFREYRTPVSMDEFYRLSREVSRKTYQEKLLGAGIPQDDNFKNLLLSLAAQDKVRGYVLFHQEQPIAYLYCPVENNCILYRYLGFDPDYSKYSPGNILQLLAIELLLQEGGYKIFDFTEGEGAHKEFFSTHNQLCGDIFFLKNKFVAIILLHMLTTSFSSLVVSTFEFLGVKSKVKKILRNLSVFRNIS